MTATILSFDLQQFNLMNELSRFGLSANEWFVEKREPGGAVFSHKFDPEFRLAARVRKLRNGRIKITDMKIESL